MRTQRHALLSEFYARVVRLRAGGAQTYEIAARLNEPEAKVREALEFMVERYCDALASRGRVNLIAEQAMAIEVSMTQLTSLLGEVTRPEVKVQIIRAREALRKEWLNLIAQVGIVDVKPSTAFTSGTANLTDEQRRKLIEIGLRQLKRLKQIKQKEAAQAAVPAQPPLPGGVEEDEEDDSGPDVIH